MKRLFYAVIIIVNILGCGTREENVEMNSILDQKLTTIMESYQEAVSNKENNLLDPSVYVITFFEEDNHCFLSIYTQYFYRTDIDGFQLKAGKLITFENLNSKCNDGFVKLTRSPELNTLDDFISENEAYDPYSPAYWTFKIENGNLVLSDQGRHKINLN